MDLDPETERGRIEDLEERLRANAGDDGLRDELGWALTTLARAEKDLGDLAAAERTFRRALAVRGELAARTGSREARRDLARSHRDLGWLIEKSTRAAEAEACHRTALGLREGLHAEAPADPEAAADLASSLRDLAAHARDEGRNGEAQGHFTRAAGLLEGLVATTLEGEDRVDLLEDLAWTRRMEAWLLERLGRMRDAERSLEAATAIHRRLLADHPAHEDRAYWHAKLGGELALLGGWLEKADRLEEAEAALVAAVEALEAALGADQKPTTGDLARDDLVDALRALELVLHVQGRRDEALDARRRAKLARRRRR